MTAKHCAPLILFAFLTIIPSGSPWAFEPLFDTTFMGWPSGVSGAGAIAAADFNNDGITDVVTCTYPQLVFGVVLGNGDGSFHPLTQYNLGAYANDVTVADFNLDGNWDVALACPEANTVFVLLGNGDGTFGRQIWAPCGQSPNSAVCGDLNGDEYPDIAAANQGSHTVSVTMGIGDGTFGPDTEYLLPEDCRYLVIADLDEDGWNDIVTTWGSNIAVLLNDHTGGFSAPVSYGTGGAHQIVAADLNQDGHVDLAVTNGVNTAGYGTSSVAVLLGQGTGAFGPIVKYPCVNWSNDLTASDVNRDGHLDLIVGSTGSTDKYSVLLGNGNGAFRARTDYPTGHDMHGILAANTDTDQWPDIVVSTHGMLSVSLNRGDGRFGPNFLRPTQGAPRQIVSGDFNEDGIVDLAATFLTTRKVGILTGYGLGGFTEDTLSAGDGPLGIATVDLDHDGDLDLVTTTHNAGTLGVFLGHGDGSFSSRTTFPCGASPNCIVLADFNEDGSLDAAVTNDGDAQTVSFLMGNGNGTFGAKTSYATGPYPVWCAAGDLNNDGHVDVVTADELTGSMGDPGLVSVFWGAGNGTFARTDVPVGGAGPIGVDIGDVNEDGNLDIIADDAAQIAVVIGHGDGTFSPAQELSTATYHYGLSVNDLNGDGHLDIFAGNDLGYCVTVMLGNGDGTFGSPMYYGSAHMSSDVTAADFNGDGKQDIACANHGGNSKSLPAISILLNIGSGGVSGVPAPPQQQALQLSPARPNPFEHSVNLAYTVNKAGPVSLAIFDVAGRKIATLVSGTVPAGTHEVTWNGKSDRGQRIAGGIYVARLESAGEVRSEKIIYRR